MMEKILIAENNEDFSYVLKWHFEQKEYEVFTTNTGSGALELYKTSLPDIILLDINLDGEIDGEIDGKDVARNIRSIDKNTPIIFMSGESKSPKDVVEGFEIGCNFFLKKPVSIEEIEAHILALENKKTIQEIFKFNHCIFNTNKRCIIQGDKRDNLSEKETLVLQYLATYLSQGIDLYDILEEVWGDTSMEESLRNVISSLRKKISDKGLIISTIKNKGYVLEDTPI